MRESREPPAATHASFVPSDVEVPDPLPSDQDTAIPAAGEAAGSELAAAALRWCGRVLLVVQFPLTALGLVCWLSQRDPLPNVVDQGLLIALGFLLCHARAPHVRVLVSLWGFRGVALGHAGVESTTGDRLVSVLGSVVVILLLVGGVWADALALLRLFHPATDGWATIKAFNKALSFVTELVVGVGAVCVGYGRRAAKRTGTRSSPPHLPLRRGSPTPPGLAATPEERGRHRRR